MKTDIGTADRLLGNRPQLTPLDDVIDLTARCYDRNTSQVCVDELKLPKPDVHLKARSGSCGARLIVRSHWGVDSTGAGVVLTYQPCSKLTRGTTRNS
jgi:hypothetical protein